jgi:hypothetical protein
VDLALDVESYYPRARGGTDRDEALRRELVRFANNSMKEIERDRRWSLSYGAAQLVTVAGTAIYPLPAGLLTIDSLYRLDPAGTAIPLDSYDATEMRIAWGEGAASVQGPPTMFSVQGGNIQIFPVPDFAGPTAGNYTLIFAGYQSLLPIVETTGYSAAAAISLGVQSSAYLTNHGIGQTGSFVSVRNAGSSQFIDLVDTHLCGWTGNAANVVTLTVATPTAQPTGTQTFFNSVNWIIQDWPKVLEFAVLREVACYLKDDYKTWEQRYQDEMERMAGFDIDRQTTMITLATAQAGAKINQLRRLDVVMGVEVRGGVL